MFVGGDRGGAPEDCAGVPACAPSQNTQPPSSNTDAIPPSHPVLSLRSVLSRSSTLPSAHTTSNPSTLPCRDPYRTNRSPPAAWEHICRVRHLHHTTHPPTAISKTPVSAAAFPPTAPIPL
jgi:hypothetical protein